MFLLIAATFAHGRDRARLLRRASPAVIGRLCCPGREGEPAGGRPAGGHAQPLSAVLSPTPLCPRQRVCRCGFHAGCGLACSHLVQTRWRQRLPAAVSHTQVWLGSARRRTMKHRCLGGARQREADQIFLMGRSLVAWWMRTRTVARSPCSASWCCSSCSRRSSAPSERQPQLGRTYGCEPTVVDCCWSRLK